MLKNDCAETAMLRPFEPTAHLRLDRYGDAMEGEPQLLDLEVGGYLALYTGQPGTGNLNPDDVDPVPPGFETQHPTQLTGGAFRVRDYREALNLAVRAVAVFDDLGVLEHALQEYSRAQRRGVHPGTFGPAVRA